MTQYYTYILINSLDSQPFYIGKGTGPRMYQHLKEAQRKDFTKRSVHQKINSIIIKGGHVLYQKIDWETEEQAFNEEKRLISLYGRKDIKTGILCNLTDGGEGPGNRSEETKAKSLMVHLGAKRSDIAKQHMKEAQRILAARNREVYGTGVRPETIIKMSKNRKGKPWSENARAAKRNKPTSIPVLAYEKSSGICVGEWNSLSECARALNCDVGAICKILNGWQSKTPDGKMRPYKSHRGYTFKYK